MVLEVGQIGFELKVSPSTLQSIGEPGDTVHVHTAVVMRESEWSIFGFASATERQLFELCQSVTGIGPKLALALVGTLGVTQLVEAIANEDQKLISKVPGVGPKVAQRIILELKSKIENWRGQVSGTADADEPSIYSEPTIEVRSYLETLGYTPTEVELALKKAREEKIESEVESLVRFSLKILSTAKAI